MYRIKYDTPNDTIKEQIIRAQFFPALTLYRINHVIEIMIKKSTNPFMQHSKAGTLNDGREWLMVVDDQHMEAFKTVFKSLIVSVDSQVIIGHLKLDGSINV